MEAEMNSEMAYYMQAQFWQTSQSDPWSLGVNHLF